MKSKQRPPSQVEDECLACLGYFAFVTGRIKESELVRAFAVCTRLDAPTDGAKKRQGWWSSKFDNIHCAFKSLEGEVVHERPIPRTKGNGRPSSDGVQLAIREGALRLFLQDFDKCIELALRALDSSLPQQVQLAVFGVSTGVSTGSQAIYHLGFETQEVVDSLQGRVPEGALKLRKHWYLERDSSLPKEAKAAFKAKHGELFCEICRLRPEPTYGHEIVDAHHRLPLSKYAERQKTYTEPADFAILCPSCHRAVHKQKDCDMSEVVRLLPSSGVQFKPKLG